MTTSKILDYVPQPDSFTCQSACVAMLTGNPDVYGIRSQLEALGEPGNPYIMGEYLKDRVVEYAFSDRGSIINMVDWLNQGYTLITHGYFSGSGHVVVVSGHRNDCFIVDDPYGEFEASSWQYTANENGDDLPYSELLIYAACMISHSRAEAIAAYNSGGIVRDFQAAWVHRIKN